MPDEFGSTIHDLFSRGNVNFESIDNKNNRQFSIDAIHSDIMRVLVFVLLFSVIFSQVVWFI